MAKFACNKQNMTALVEALESGEYQQAKSYLRQGDAYCCLGVASDLYRRSGDGVKSYWRSNYGDAWTFVDDLGNEQRFALTRGVHKWLGLDGSKYESDLQLNIQREDAPEWLWAEEQYEQIGAASGINDTGSDFATIARMIRRDYLEDDPEPEPEPLAEWEKDLLAGKPASPKSEWEKLGGAPAANSAMVLPPSDKGYTVMTVVVENK